MGQQCFYWFSAGFISQPVSFYCRVRAMFISILFVALLGFIPLIIFLQLMYTKISEDMYTKRVVLQ